MTGIEPDERALLGQLPANVLANLPEMEMNKHRICRLGSVRVCGDYLILGNAI